MHLYSFIPWLRSIAVGEQLLPLELSSETDEDHLHPTKSSMDTIGMALGQVTNIRLSNLKYSVPNQNQCLTNCSIYYGVMLVGKIFAFSGQSAKKY